MNVAWLREDLYEFAIELRKLAYSAPAAYEDPLVRLSERMFRYATASPLARPLPRSHGRKERPGK
jgi:hypothetical protein